MKRNPFILIIILSLINFQSLAQLKVAIGADNLEPCISNRVRLASNIISGQPTSFTWSAGGGTFFSKNDSVTFALFTKSGYVYLQTSDGTNTHLDSVWMKVNPLPNVQLADAFFCVGADSLNLKADKILLLPANTSIGIQKWTCLDSGSQQWSKIIKNRYPNIKGYPQDYTLDLRPGHFDLGTKTKETLKLELVYTDANGCVNSDTANITGLKNCNPKIIRSGIFDMVTNFEPFLVCSTRDTIEMFPDILGGIWWCSEKDAVVNNLFIPSKVISNKPFYIHYTLSNLKLDDAKDSVHVQIEHVPQISIVTNDTTIYSNKAVTIKVTADTSNTQGISWIPLNGGKVDKTNKTTVVFTADNDPDSCIGRFLYVQTNPGNACPFRDDIFVLTICPDTTGAINPLNGRDMRIKVYPNPSTGTIHIPELMDYEIQILNDLGQQQTFTILGSETIRLANPGHYLLMCYDKTSKQRFTKQLIVLE